MGDIALVDQRTRQHSELDGPSIRVGGASAPQRRRQMGERRPAGLLEEGVLREDLVEIELEGGPDRAIQPDVPERGDGLEEAVVAAVLPIDADDRAETLACRSRGRRPSDEGERRDDDLVDEAARIALRDRHDVEVPEAADAGELRLDIRPGDRPEPVMGHAHGQQAGHATGTRLQSDRGVQLLQAIEQLVRGGLHADLDRVIEPVALGFRGCGRDRRTEGGRVRQAPDIGRSGGHREQNVRGEEHLASRIRDRIGRRGADRHYPGAAETRDPVIFVPDDPDALREPGAPGRLASRFRGRGSGERVGGGRQPRRERAVAARPLPFRLHAPKAVAVEGGDAGSGATVRCHEGVPGRCVVCVAVPGCDDEECHRDARDRVGVRSQPRGRVEDRAGPGTRAGPDHPGEDRADRVGHPVGHAVGPLDGHRDSYVSRSISAMRRSTNASSASATGASSGGGTASSRSRFQIVFARCVAVNEPSASHDSKLRQSDSIGV